MLKRNSTTCLAAAVEEPSPKRLKPSIDDYRFCKQIREGAHGAVYLAKHLATGKTVAVKVQELDDDVRSEVEFHSEVAAHPSAVTLKEVIVGHGAVYMVMPYSRYNLRFLLDGSPKGFQEARVRSSISQLLGEAEDEMDLLNKVFRVLGEPDWPEFYHLPLVKEGVLDLQGIKEDADLADVIPTNKISYNCFHLLSRMLTTNPNHRITAMQALAHPWFEDRPH